MPARIQRFELHYGNFVAVGDAVSDLTADETYLVSRYRHLTSPRQAIVEAEVLVVSTDDGTFRDRVNELEDAFRLPRQRLRIRLEDLDAGGFTDIADYNPSTAANTGYDAQPAAEKLGDPLDDHRRRLYRVTVAVTLPVTLSGQAGRDDTTITVTSLPSSVRQVTFAGTYSALAGRDATEVYNDEAQSFAEATLATNSEFSGDNWELVTPIQTITNDSDKVVEWTLTYEQIIHGETAENDFSDAEIVQHRLQVQATEASLPWSPYRSGFGGRSWQPYAATWSCFVDVAQDDLVQVARTKVIPRIVEEVRNLTQSSQVIVDAASPVYDPVTQQLVVTMAFRGVSSTGGSLLESTYTISQQRLRGNRYVPVGDGDPDTFWKLPGKRSLIRTVVISRLVAGRLARDTPPALGDLHGLGELFRPADGGFEVVSSDISTTPIEFGHGQEFGDTLEAVRIEESRTLRFVRLVSAGGGSGIAGTRERDEGE